MAEPVVVVVGGWEHLCCGLPIEIGDVVECAVVSADGARRFAEVRHGTVSTQVIRGRVVELRLVAPTGSVPIARVPSGRALRGFDEDDDGHLEARWSGEEVVIDRDLPGDGPEFEVVVDPYGKRDRRR